MIDHVSISVSDLSKSELFYTQVFAVLGYELLDTKQGTIGFGKKYPDFWLNERKSLTRDQSSDGFHVCLRAKSIGDVDKFYELALKNGATCNGAPALRPQHGSNYYAAFITDFDGNKVEVVTFI
jgi:catechol 2,3-dioxygenase-like lactoylglutathione lyase family enzyme